MAAGTRWLGDDIRLRVEWEDATPFGGPIGSRLEDHLRELWSETMRLLVDGADPTGPEVRASLAAGVSGEAFGRLAEPTSDGAGWNIRPDVLAPDPDATRPARLRLGADTGASVDVEIPSARWPAIHELLAGLSSNGADPDRAIDPAARALFRGLDEHGFLSDVEPEPTPSRTPGVTAVGHACVMVTGNETSVLIDPFMPARSSRYPDGYQPVTVRELGPIGAVLLTHAHPDHFDPGTLLRLPVDTPIVVPLVGTETILAPDLERRMRELGFVDVRARPWGSTEQVGDLVVQVLAFLGEQPATDRVLHPDVVAAGNTYVVTAPWGRLAAIADGGRDRRGSMIDVARTERSRHGPVDIVFSGYRGWETSPAQLLRSSVGRYTLFVPPDRWDTCDALMNDPASAVANAEAFGASVVVPYADGGAPWFWELGLGPRLDEQPREHAGFDLFPERVAEAAERSGSSVTVQILRSGETWSPAAGRRCPPGHVWPWPPVT